jgi:hypothetical protein
MVILIVLLTAFDGIRPPVPHRVASVIKVPFPVLLRMIKLLVFTLSVAHHHRVRVPARAAET